MENGWIQACSIDNISPGDVIRFDYQDRTFAIYRTTEDKFSATEGLCTHGKVHLANGFVMDTTIECPKHNGRFNFTTGEPTRAPACERLTTYAVKVESGCIFIQPG